jgi:hypothetical protein
MRSVIVLILSVYICCALSIAPVWAQVEAIRAIVFPTDMNATLTGSFGDPRTGHAHEGEDIMGEQMMPLYAAVDGRIKDLVDPEASWGYAITIIDPDGYRYHYLHVNNDNPGTDGGQGGTLHAYAPGLTEGVAVTAGELIGWMGDSGNAEAAGPHLHFEIRTPDDIAIDPGPSLQAALHPATDYDVDAALLASPDINTDQALVPATGGACASGSLIKLSDSQAVYYCGADGKRHVFPNEKIYFSWYADFAGVVTVDAMTMADLALGHNVTYRPGTRLVKIQTDPKVYAVAKGGELRWIRSAATAATLYSEDWRKQVDDLPDAFFFDYRVGEVI